MLHKAKDLSHEQRAAIESLLGRAVAENEIISLKTVSSDEIVGWESGTAAAPAWLRESWSAAERLGLDGLSMEEIDSEIQAARKDRLSPPREQ